MKKILFLLLCVCGMQAQTLQNPTFGNTTTNTLKVKTPATVTSTSFLPAFDADGITVSKIVPTSSIITNASTVTGATTTDALNTLNALKADLASPTFTGVVTSPIINLSPQSLSSASNYIGQISSSDWWKIYQYYTTGDQTEMVLEVGDNGQPFASGGQRFRFHYDATTGGTAKDPFTIDYNVSTFDTDIIINGATASTIASFDASKNIKSLSTATYPSLTELSYVKGVTSSIQTQLNAKQATLTNPITGTGTANTLPKFSGTSTLANSIITDSGSLVDILANSSASIDTRLSVSSTGNGAAGRGTAILMNVPGSANSVNGVKINAYTMGGATASQSTDLAFDVGLSGTLTERMRITSTGVVKIANLAGTGSRQVVADASGNLSAVAGTLISTFTDVSTVSTSQETLFTYTLPANSLANNGDRLKIMVTASSSVANVSGSLEFGGNVFYNYSAVSAGNNNSLFTFIRVDSTTVRVIRNDIGSATNYTVSNLTSATNVFNFKYTSLAGAGGATLKAVSIDLVRL